MKAKGVLKNIGGSFIMQAVNILTNLILPPMIISYYGSSINGLTGTITQIISYISLVGAGLSVATTQSLYKPLAEHDEYTISGMMRATGDMFNRVGWLFLLISALIAMVYPLLIKSELEYFFVVLLMLIMSISGAAEFFATGRYRSLLYADRKIYVFSLVQSLCLLISTTLAVVCIKLELSILWTQAMISLVYVLRGLCLSAYVKRHYAFIKKNVKPINECIAKRKDAMYHQLIGLVVTGSQAILLSIFIGLEAASIYGIYNTVFSGLQSICVQINNSVVPYLGRTFSIGRKEDIEKKFELFELVFFILITVVFATSLIMIEPFIGIYTRNADIDYVDRILSLMFVLRGFVSAFRLPAQGMINAAGFFAETKKAATVEAIVCITLELISVRFWGIYGIMLGSMVSIGWRSFEMVFFANKHIISRNSRVSVLRIMQAGMSIALSCYLCRKIFLHTVIADWTSWIYFAVLVVGISGVITFAIYLITEKERIRDAMQTLI